MLNNIVDNIEQRGQHNIVQACIHQRRTGCAFLAVYARQKTKVKKKASQLNITVLYFKVYRHEFLFPGWKDLLKLFNSFFY